jgi:hypothetical protein
MFLEGTTHMRVTRSRPKLRILLEIAEEKSYMEPRIDGKKMVERILKNSKRERLGTFGSVLSCDIPVVLGTPNKGTTTILDVF